MSGVQVCAQTHSSQGTPNMSDKCCLCQNRSVGKPKERWGLLAKRSEWFPQQGKWVSPIGRRKRRRSSQAGHTWTASSEWELKKAVMPCYSDVTPSEVDKGVEGTARRDSNLSRAKEAKKHVVTVAQSIARLKECEELSLLGAAVHVFNMTHKMGSVIGNRCLVGGTPRTTRLRATPDWSNLSRSIESSWHGSGRPLIIWVWQTPARYVLIVFGARPSWANEAAKQHSRDSFTGKGWLKPNLAQNNEKRLTAALYALCVDGARPRWQNQQTSASSRARSTWLLSWGEGPVSWIGLGLGVGWIGGISVEKRKDSCGRGRQLIRSFHQKCVWLTKWNDSRLQ